LETFPIFVTNLSALSKPFFLQKLMLTKQHRSTIPFYICKKIKPFLKKRSFLIVLKKKLAKTFGILRKFA